MKLHTFFLLTTMTSAISFATGCGNDTTSETDKKDDHTHPEGKGHAHGEGDEHGHTVGTVEIEGWVIELSFDGELEAGKTYHHCHVSMTGDKIDALRVWVGDVSGGGSLKSLVQGVGSDHMFVDLVAPADITGALLGVEIEVGDETYTATTLLDHHDEDEGDHNDDHDDHAGHDHD